MEFVELQAGDVFKAHGAEFQKLPAIRAMELADANAININTRQLAFFGESVPVEYLERGDADLNGRRLLRLLASIA